MNFELFSTGNSPLHRADPRVKLISALALSGVLAGSTTLITVSAGLFIGCMLVFLAKLSPTAIIRRLLLVNSFNAFLFLLLPFTYGQAPFYEIAGIKVSQPGLILAVIITIKGNGIVLFFISLIATSTIAELGSGLQKLHVSSRLCMILLFSYRYISVLYNEYKKLQRAAKLRCFRPSTNFHTYKTYAHLFGMLLVKSWNRAENVQKAMVLRGFSGKFHSIKQSRFSPHDLILFSGSSLAALVLFFLERVY